MQNIFFNSLWPGLVAWSLLYTSDYYLTLAGARLYRSGANEKIVFEGSYELTPFFQRDIDALRPVSPRFVLMWLYGACLLALVWFLSSRELPQLYEVALGSTILMQLAVHTKHLRNIFLFNSIRHDADAVRGRIEYSRGLILRISSYEWFVFSGVFFCLFVLTQSWFFSGGALAALSLGGKHRRLAQKPGPANAPTVQTSKEPWVNTPPATF